LGGRGGREAVARGKKNRHQKQQREAGQNLGVGGGGGEQESRAGQKTTKNKKGGSAIGGRSRRGKEKGEDRKIT